MTQKQIKTYECRIEGYFKDGTDLVSNHIATSNSAARYMFWQEHAELLHPYRECFQVIKVRSLGVMQPSHYFKNKDDFIRVCEMRGIPFADLGMSVDVNGKNGRLVGVNCSANIDVLFEGTGHILNCHPTWETTFYDDKGSVVMNFKERKPAIRAV